MALPAGWDSADIGTVGASGASNESGGTYTISGAGFDVYARDDGFQFAWQPAKDNAVITARVATLTGSNTIAGVTLRQTLRSNSKHVSLLATQFGGVELRSRIGITETRSGMGGLSAINARQAPQAVPVYLRLTRSGATVQAAYSTNGSSYTNIGSAIRINFADKLYVGLVVCGRSGSTGSATFDNVSVTANTPGDFYYVSPSATSGAGTWASPYSIYQISADSPPAFTAGSTVWLLAGTYFGHPVLSVGGSIGSLVSYRGYPGERAIIDENKLWTLANGISNGSSDRTLDFVSTAGLNVGDVLIFDTEAIQLDKNGSAAANQFNLCNRGWRSTTISNHSAGATGRFDGSTVSSANTVVALSATGGYQELRDLEITDSYLPDRIIDTSSSNPALGRRSDGLTVAASNCRIVDCFVYNTGQVLFSGTAYNGVEFNGVIGLNCGWEAPDRGHGHGLYIQASTSKIAKDCVLSNNFGGYGLHAFTSSGQVKGIDVNGCAFIPGGSSVNNRTAFLNGQLESNQFRNSFVFGGGASGLQMLGDQDTNLSANVENNRIYALIPIDIEGFTGMGTATLLNNVCVGVNDLNGGLVLSYWKTASGTASAYSYTTNSWYKGANEIFRTGPVTGTHITNTFVQWQALGYDTAGTYSGSTGALPAANETTIRASDYDANRAMLVILNWQASSSVNVDPSAFLSSGDVYAIYFALNPFADPVASGTYTSGNIAISMARRAFQQPLGAINLPVDALVPGGTVLGIGTFLIVKK